MRRPACLGKTFDDAPKPNFESGESPRSIRRRGGREYRFAGRWYEARREHLGIEFFDAVDEAIDRILEQPRSGSPVPRMPADLLVRAMAVTRFPYRVVYLQMNDRIRILAVAHDRRKPGYWKARLKR